MNNVNQAAEPLTVEEYIQMELHSERRHEYISGQLIEMPGDKAVNNEIAIAICVYLRQQLKLKGFKAYINDVKISSHDRSKYFYPDVFVTKEADTETTQYIKYEPELIVEVISPSSHITDTVDKYIAYTQIPSLKYYLIVEPETVYAMLYSKNGEGVWEVMKFVHVTDSVPMPLLGLTLPLAEIYGHREQA